MYVNVNVNNLRYTYSSPLQKPQRKRENSVSSGVADTYVLQLLLVPGSDRLQFAQRADSSPEC